MPSTELTPKTPLAEFRFNGLLLTYRLHGEDGPVTFSLLPASRAADRVSRPDTAPLHPSQNREGNEWARFQTNQFPDSLVHLHLRGEGLPKGFAAGKTLRNSATTSALRFLDQTVTQTESSLVILTRLRHPCGLLIHHQIEMKRDLPGVLCECSVQHQGDAPVVIEHLSSFSLGDLSPFAADDMPDRGRIHRFRTAWSLEGRHESASLEDLHLERTWSGYGEVNLRYGQAGSMPVRDFFPFVAFEDTQSGVMWGAQLAWHGSWQMEVQRRGDPLVLGGSHADYDVGHWAKPLQPGETFAAPPALLASVSGDVDDLCRQLVLTQNALSHKEPAEEESMPMIFNEWCSSWGNPTHEKITATAARLQQTPTSIFVIDDGWACRSAAATMQSNGDWIVDTEKFPQGLKAATAAMRAAGLIPGIWFEFEVCNKGNPAFELTDHQLTRHGQVIEVGDRRFWDFRDPWTFEYLRKKVIGLLRENDFGYMKVDYNDSIGIGCDVADDPDAGLGEGLRQHLEKVKDFFQEIRRELPDLILENCSSGGHRLEPGMVGLTSMSSFSDAHECVEIPIIGANLLRLIPARKNQIWVVVRPHDSPQRLTYGFAATLMGRMAVSGDLTALNQEQTEVMDRAQSFYQNVHAVIRDGVPRVRQEDMGPSYRHPAGSQTVTFHRPESGELLVIHHRFDHPGSGEQPLQLPEGHWQIHASLDDDSTSVTGGKLHVPPGPAFSANAFHLKRLNI